MIRHERYSEGIATIVGFGPLSVTTKHDGGVLVLLHLPGEYAGRRGWFGADYWGEGYWQILSWGRRIWQYGREYTKPVTATEWATRYFGRRYRLTTSLFEEPCNSCNFRTCDGAEGVCREEAT